MYTIDIKFEGNPIDDAFNNPKLQKELEVEIRKNFALEKQKLVNNFENHEISKEVRKPNRSKGSALLGSYKQGNLFGFIGFNEGADPISPVVKEINKITDIKAIIFERSINRDVLGRFTTGKQKKIRVAIEVPDLNDFKEASKEVVPATSTFNWVKSIERGTISGYKRFLGWRDKRSRGRSGEGVITKTNLRSGNFRHRPGYVTGLINSFVKNFSGVTFFSRT
jgi:hypothetical protein